MTRRYKYLGDFLTRPDLRGAHCEAVLRADGKCVRGKNGLMVVRFDNGEQCGVIGRLLRKVTTDANNL